MPDAKDRIDAPGDWRQALAALPLESPPADSWNRIVGRLSAASLPSARRRRWPLALAAAATLTAAVIVPARWWSAPEPAAPMAATPEATPAKPQSLSSSAASGRSSAVAGQTLPAAVPADGRRTGYPSDIPAQAIAATKKPVRPPAQRPASDAATDTTPAAPPTLEALYVESAHLESLLAQIQDERVANGPAMAMTGALEDRIAAIDHALVQPGSDGQQHALWQQRVEALRQLAGLEGTQRWLAASGNAGSDGSRIY